MSKLMVFKVDFKKAFDTISWDFLFQVLHFMGFNETWIRWISGCLYSAAASILIIGSPTCEFNIHRGLRQGDPLSPFLFIIAMEGLYVAMEDAMSAGLYNGFRINTLNLSYLFFADDALFIEEWSNTNIKSLVSILDCFHQVSGLKINFNKSNLFGVGVPFAEVVSLASITGCNTLSMPFNYLGLPIYCNMDLVKSWYPIIDKFSKCLSNWKALLLSIGGRTTLITSVLGTSSLKNQFLRLFRLALNKDALVRDCWNNGWHLSWSRNISSAFTVKDARGKIDDGFLPDDGFETRWNGFLPKKNRVFIWLDLSPLDFPSLHGLFSWLDDLHISSSKKDIIEVVCGVLLWSLWNFRNDMIFGNTHPSGSTLFDKIVDFSFGWYSSRNKLSSISWNNYIQNPIEMIEEKIKNTKCVRLRGLGERKERKECLQELADSKEAFNFKLDQQDVEFTVVDLCTMLNLPQANDNKQEAFVDPPELLTIFKFLPIMELKSLGKAKAPTTIESHRMKELLDNMMKKRYKISEENVYHLEQAKNHIENQIVWESREEELIPQDPKKEAPIFFGPQRNPNEPLISCVIWEKVHDYQLGIESYQIKINLIDPTLVILGIEAPEPYTIITDPFIRIVYENSKKERRVMNIDELRNFCDPTLNKVLKKVKEIVVVARYGYKDPPLNEEHKKEETIQDCNFTRSGFKNMHTEPRDGVTIPSDAVSTYKRRCQENCDGEPPQWKPLEDSAKRRCQDSCYAVVIYFLYIQTRF
uniref:Reverse transcriptase domain, reverse transcriptase zinc-binding domain protein n=1 Tax=Tanacetum cinerariifolium TaxID=118510 RepID=A0A6L2NNB5_TANCI|nr:reverse transcriptase domain, reverse transcriptase zinc-binding domain protein [Tanacetum cinerariifolium]